MHDAQYKIPELHVAVGQKPGWIYLIWPLMVLAFLCFQAMNSPKSYVWADAIFSGIAMSVFGNIVVHIIVVIVIEIIGGPGSQRRVKQHWEKHSYAWYRSSFPEHAHANGRISCRHCGGHKMRVTNLMKQTYMRVHNCAQCGETLYFTPEKI